MLARMESASPCFIFTGLVEGVVEAQKNKAVSTRQE